MYSVWEFIFLHIFLVCSNLKRYPTCSKHLHTRIKEVSRWTSMQKVSIKLWHRVLKIKTDSLAINGQETYAVRPRNVPFYDFTSHCDLSSRAKPYTIAIIVMRLAYGNLISIEIKVHFPKNTAAILSSWFMNVYKQIKNNMYNAMRKNYILPIWRCPAKFELCLSYRIIRFDVSMFAWVCSPARKRPHLGEALCWSHFSRYIIYPVKLLFIQSYSVFIKEFKYNL